MSRRVDERAVTVQIGAVLMLAILVSALALYQVSAVPDQNQETEFTHSERVTGELVELRDTIRNAGSERLERGVPITLGAQYQTRTVAINPPAPSGRLSTSDPRPVTIENATVEEGDPDGTVQDILTNTSTTRLLTYEPRYNEYRGPTTRIEHSLLYNEFDEANVTLEEQTTIDDDSVTLVFLEGNLSRSTTRTVSVDVETIGGPTGKSEFKSNGSGNVTITLPTDSPERWEAALGTTFEGSPQENARIRPDDDRRNVTIELANETYDLRLAQVSVGDGSTPDGRFDDARESGDESETDSGSGNDVFTAEWGGDAVSADGSGGSELTLEEGQSETVNLTVSDTETNDPVANVWVDFARQSGGDGAVNFTSETYTETDADGIARINVTGESEGETAIFASTASGTVRLPVTVEPPADGPYFNEISHRIDDLSHEGQNDPEFVVSYDVENTSSSFERVDVVFEGTDGGPAAETISNDATRGHVRYTNDWGFGETYEITIQVISVAENGDESIVAERTITETANTENPSDNEDVSTVSSPEITDWVINDSSNQGQGARFEVSYELSSEDDFTEAELLAIGLDGATIDRTTTTTTGSSRLNPQGGRYDDFLITVLVFDSDGVVTDTRRDVVTADG